MTLLLSLLVWAAFILLIIGLFSPDVSLFWYKKERTRKRSALIYGLSIVCLMVFGGISTLSDRRSARNVESGSVITPAAPASAVSAQESSATFEEQSEAAKTQQKLKEEANSASSEKEIMAQIKQKAKEDFADNYTLQEFSYKEQVKAFRYMQKVTDIEVKRQSEEQFPEDYTLQKFNYDQEVKAKRRMQ